MKGTKSHLEPTIINKEAKVGNIHAEDESPSGFRCTCCGRSYTRQRNNFPPSMSPLWKENDGYFPVCKRCVERYFYQLVDFFSGNEEKAMDRVAQIADWYYSDDTWAMTRKDKSRVGMYPSKMQLPQCKENGTTYLDTIKDRATAVVSDYDEFEEMKEQGDISVSKAQIARWGLGFEESEYRQLDAHYKSLSDIIDTTDVVQDTLAKDLCEIKIQQIRARNKGDADMFQKFTKLYQDTLKTANLRVKSGEVSALSDSESCWGNFVRDVEKYTPAELYQDKALFSDNDGLKEYMERFVLRPVRNFFMGTRDMDAEFSIGATDGEND